METPLSFKLVSLRDGAKQEQAEEQGEMDLRGCDSGAMIRYGKPSNPDEHGYRTGVPPPPEAVLGRAVSFTLLLIRVGVNSLFLHCPDH